VFDDEPPTGGPDGGDTTELNYDTWFGEQTQDIQGLIDGNIKNLKSALESERGTRKDLEKRLRDLAAKADKGSELEAQLNELVQAQTDANRRATFYEQAHEQGITNLKLAYIVATTEDLLTSKGGVDWVELKAQYPELFAKAPSNRTNAGAGADDTVKPVKSMDNFIRLSAGRDIK